MSQQTLNVTASYITTKVFIISSFFKVNFNINNRVILTLNLYDVCTTRCRNKLSYLFDTSSQQYFFEIMMFLIDHAYQKEEERKERNVYRDFRS